MGAVFGTIFGIMDVEDASRYQLRLALLKEEKYFQSNQFLIDGSK